MLVTQQSKEMAPENRQSWGANKEKGKIYKFMNLRGENYFAKGHIKTREKFCVGGATASRFGSSAAEKRILQLSYLSN